MKKNILSCRRIKKRFREVMAISNVDIDLKDGEIMSILGPSGCGKTTLLRIIAGLETPDSGKITLKENTLYENNLFVEPNLRGIGMVFQEYALFPHLTVKENVLFGIRSLSNKDQNRILEDILKLTRVEELESRYPSELSGGQQQRVALARTLATKPNILLMDEPFSNLDASLRTTVRTEVKEILKRSNTSTIFVTHDKEEAFSISDKVAIMFEGVIHQVDPPDKIYFWPETKQVASLSGSCEFIDGIIDGSSVITSLGRIPRRVNENIIDGTRVDVAIRPNDFIMKADPSADNVVIRKEFRGEDTLFWIKTSAGEIICCKHKIHTTLFVGLKVMLSAEKYANFNVFRKYDENDENRTS